MGGIQISYESALQERIVTSGLYEFGFKTGRENRGAGNVVFVLRRDMQGELLSYEEKQSLARGIKNENHTWLVGIGIGKNEGMPVILIDSKTQRRVVEIGRNNFVFSHVPDSKITEIVPKIAHAVRESLGLREALRKEE